MMAVILPVFESGNLAFVEQDRNLAEMFYMQVLSVRERISVIREFISERQLRIDKLLNYFVVIVGAILCAIFTVQIVERKMHCATWWTLPVLATIASAGIIVAIALKVYTQLRALLVLQPLFQQLNRFVDTECIESQLLMRLDNSLFNSLRTMQMPFHSTPSNPFSALQVGWLILCVARLGLSVGPVGLSTGTNAAALVKHPRTRLINALLEGYQSRYYQHLLKRARPSVQPGKELSWYKVSSMPRRCNENKTMRTTDIREKADICGKHESMERWTGKWTICGKNESTKSWTGNGRFYGKMSGGNDEIISAVK
ncbi:hypothetical protein SUGI_0646550 [Cryptomeria japonica]|nr:hypothetical protein SUGI_0646550 [Cryptomeria japonica]